MDVKSDIFVETLKLMAAYISALQYVVVMGLVLGPSLMVISTMGILLYAKVSPLHNVLWECIVVFYT